MCVGKERVLHKALHRRWICCPRVNVNQRWPSLLCHGGGCGVGWMLQVVLVVKVGCHGTPHTEHKNLHLESSLNDGSLFIESTTKQACLARPLAVTKGTSTSNADSVVSIQSRMNPVAMDGMKHYGNKECDDLFLQFWGPVFGSLR